jgi:hypothetical protein
LSEESEVVMFELIGKEEYSIVRYVFMHRYGDEWQFAIDSNENIIDVTLNGEAIELTAEVVLNINAMIELI